VVSNEATGGCEVKVLGVEVQPAEAERESVLDIPAIDMTEGKKAASPSQDSDRRPAKPKARNARASNAASQKGRAKSRRRPAVKAAAASAAERRAAKAAAQAPPKRTRDGSVGRETFAAVEALVKQGKSKSEAFKQVATDTGKNSGTVAANYYRVARTEGAVKPRRGRRATSVARESNTITAGRRRRSAASNGTDISRLSADLVKSVQALADAVQAQGREVAELRSRLDGVRKAVG
jgi:hypothetical protein